MGRAVFTFSVVVLLTGVLGVLVLTVGLVTPPRWCFNPVFRLWSWGILATAGCRVDLRSPPPRVEQGVFVVANHQSALDIPLLAYVMRGRLRFMAKESLFSIPMLGWIMKAHGFVPVDRNNARRTLDRIRRAQSRWQRQGLSMLVFAEGTRSEDGSIGPFKRGTIRACIQSGAPILPVAIDGTLSIHRRRRFRIHPGRVRVAFGELITAKEAERAGPDRLMHRLRDEIIRLIRPADAETGALPVAAETGGDRA